MVSSGFPSNILYVLSLLPKSPSCAYLFSIFSYFRKDIKFNFGIGGYIGLTRTWIKCTWQPASTAYPNNRLYKNLFRGFRYERLDKTTSHLYIHCALWKAIVNIMNWDSSVSIASMLQAGWLRNCCKIWGFHGGDWRISSSVTCSWWFLACRFLYPEDGGSTFLWNVGSHKIYSATSQKMEFLRNWCSVPARGNRLFFSSVHIGDPPILLPGGYQGLLPQEK
jgi:hypothetical protein